MATGAAVQGSFLFRYFSMFRYFPPLQKHLFESFCRQDPCFIDNIYQIAVPYAGKPCPVTPFSLILMAARTASLNFTGSATVHSVCHAQQCFKVFRTHHSPDARASRCPAKVVNNGSNGRKMSQA